MYTRVSVSGISFKRRSIAFFAVDAYVEEPVSFFLTRNSGLSFLRNLYARVEETTRKERLLFVFAFHEKIIEIHRNYTRSKFMKFL